MEVEYERGESSVCHGHAAALIGFSPSIYDEMNIYRVKSSMHTPINDSAYVLF